MLTEDYIIRMINLAIAALLRIIGLKKSASYDEALQLIDMTFEQLLGLRSSMVKNLDDERLYYLLTRGDRLDTRRLALVADLFQEEGDIYAAQNRLPESQDAYARSLRYHLEVLFQETLEKQPELPLRIEWLAEQLDFERLGADTLWPLVGYYEEVGEYARAEATLLRLAERPEAFEAIRPELEAFYERLLDVPAEDLAQGGVSPARAREQLAHWRAL